MGHEDIETTMKIYAHLWVDLVDREKRTDRAERLADQINEQRKRAAAA